MTSVVIRTVTLLEKNLRDVTDRLTDGTVSVNDEPPATANKS